jgi:hypothetical protein
MVRHAMIAFGLSAASANAALSVLGGLFLASETLGLTKRLPVNSVTEVLLVLLRYRFRRDPARPDVIEQRAEQIAESLGEALLPHDTPPAAAADRTTSTPSRSTE